MRRVAVIALVLIVVAAAAGAAWYFHPVNRYKRQLTSILEEAVALSDRGTEVIDRHGPPGSGNETGFTDEWRGLVADWEALDARAASLHAPDRYPKSHQAALGYIHESYLAARALLEEPGGGEYARHLDLAIQSADDFQRLLREEAAAR